MLTKGIQTNIVLGTAQHNKNYGLSKNKLHSSQKKINDILYYAKKNGINYLDTARVYGNAERNIGIFNKKSKKKNKFKVITKLSNLEKAPSKNLEKVIKDSVNTSFKALKENKIDILLIHNFNDLKKHGSNLIEQLNNLQKKGLIKDIGVSVYSPKEAIKCLKIKKIKHIQIPFNLIDQRWLGSDFKNKLSSRPDIKIHARSIFLRGLLLNNSKFWPKWFKNRNKTVYSIEILLGKLNKMNKVDLCLSYVKSFDWIDFILIGVDSVNHLKEVLKMNKNKKLKSKERKFVVNFFKNAINSKRILLPYLW